MKARFVKRPIGKVLSVWCAFATLATSTAPAFAITVVDQDVLSGAHLNRHSGNVDVTAYSPSSGNYEGIITSSGAGGDAVLDWGTLNIGSSETLTFDGRVSFYNVVDSLGGQSQLLGKLNGNDGANVYIFNPSGILIGNGAVIDVGGIFGAYAMGINTTTLTGWLDDPTTVAGSSDIASDGVNSVKVEDGALIKAAAIELAGNGIDLNGLSSTTETFKGPTTLVSGGALVIDSISGGAVSVKIGEATGVTLKGVDLMGKFTDALTVKAAGDVVVAGKTEVTGDVTIDAVGSVTKSDTATAGAALVTTAGTTGDGKLTVTSTEGSIQLDDTANSVVDKVSLTAEKGDVKFYNGAEVPDTTIGAVTAKNVTLETVNAMKVADAVEATAGDVSLKSTSSAVSIAETGKVTAEQNVTVDAGTWAGARGNAELKATNGDIKMTAAQNIAVYDSAKVEAGKAVTLTSTDGSIFLNGNSSTASITAKGGAVTIDATKGPVTINNATVTAKNATGGEPNGTIDIDAKNNVTISGAAELNAQKDIDIATTAGQGGLIKVEGTAKLLAEGDAALTADDALTVASGTAVTAGGNASLESTTKSVTVSGTVAANGGNATLKATKGAVMVSGGSSSASDLASVSAKGGDVILTGGMGVGVTGNAKLTATAKADSAGAAVGGNVAIKSTGAGEVPGNISIDGGTAWAYVTAEDGAVTIAANGGVTVNNATISGKGDVTLTATKGAASISGKVTASQNATIKAGTTATVSGSGSVTATAGKIDIDAGTGVAVNGTASLSAGDNVEIATTAGNVETTANTSLTADAGNLDVDATAGNITLKGKTEVAGATELNAKGSVVADNEANDFGGLVDALSTDGSISLADKGSIALNNINAKGDVTITAKDGDVTMEEAGTSLKAGGILAVTATSSAGTGDITLNGKTEVDGMTTLNAKGSVVADNSNNDFVGNVNAKADNGSVTLVDANTISLNDIDAGKTVNVKAQNIEVVASTTPGAGVTAGESIAFTATDAISVNNEVTSAKDGITFSGASVAVNNAAVTAQSDTGNIVIGATTSDVTTDAGSSLTAGGGLDVDATAGDITLKGKTEVADKTDLDATGSIVADNEDNDFKGLVDATATGTDGSVTLVDANSIQLNDIDAKGSVAVTAKDGNIEVVASTDPDAGVNAGGAITFTATKNTAEEGSITVNNKVVSTDSGDITFTASDSVAIKASVQANGTGGNVVINATKGVSVSDGANLNADEDIVIETTAGNVTTADGTSLTAGKDLVVNAANNSEEDDGYITISGTATVGGKTDLDANGAIVADNEDNDFQGLVDATVTGTDGSVTLVDKDTIQLNDIDAATTVDVTAKGGNIEVVANPAENTGVNAGERITFTANKAITVNNEVTSAKDGIKFDAGTSVTVNDATVKAQSATGTIDIDATGDVLVKGGAQLLADANVDVLTTGGAVTIQDTAKVDATAGYVKAEAQGVKVTGNAIVDAGTAVTLKSTAADVTIDAKKSVDDKGGTVTAKNGAVTIDSAGKVTVENTVVKATGATDGKIDIDATGDVLVKGGAQLLADADVDVLTKGAVLVESDALVTAGGDATLKSEVESITVAGAVTAGGNVTATAAKDVTVSGTVAANGGNAELTAAKGKVTVNGTETAVASVSTIGGDVKLSGGTGVEVAQYGKASATAKVIATPTGTTTVGGNVELTAMSDDATLADDEKNVVIAGRVEGNGDITVKAKNDITVNATGSVLANKNVSATAANNVTVNGSVEADKAVTLNSTGTGNITVEGTATVKATVTANDGKVTIDADNGAVTINNAIVTAMGTGGTIDIDATADITVTDTAKLDAGQNLEVTTTGGDVTIEGTATVKGKTDLDANGSIVANNANNDFGGLVDATATDGSVELVGKNTVKLNDIDAATTVSVSAKDIEVVANNDANTGVNAGGSINLNADNSIAVNNAVDATTGNIVGKAANGDITFGANGTMKANNGNATLNAGKSIASANKSTAILAKGTVDVSAKNDIGSPLNVSSSNLKVVSGGSANVTVKKSAFNPNGNLAVDGSKTSIETGKDLNLTVEGNLSTPGGVIKVGNNLDLAVNSATPEIDLTLGGNTIRATDKTDAALAFKLHGGNKYPTVIGTDSGTAVFIDGRLAGGDSAYYSILGSYEAQAALGMTPDIRGAKADEAPVLFRDKNQNVIDVLPNTWDAQLDDTAVVPEEAKASDAASKVARR